MPGSRPRPMGLSRSACTVAVFSVAPSTTARGCLLPSLSIPTAATSVNSSRMCRPSIWIARRLSRHVAARQTDRTTELPRRDTDQHHSSPTCQASPQTRGLPTRQRNLTAVPTHTRPLDRDRAAMEIQPPDRPPPAMAAPLFRAAMARTTKPLGVILHHAPKRGDAG